MFFANKVLIHGCVDMWFFFTSKENFEFVTPRYGRQDYILRKLEGTKKVGFMHYTRSLLKMEKNMVFL